MMHGRLHGLGPHKHKRGMSDERAARAARRKCARPPQGGGWGQVRVAVVTRVGVLGCCMSGIPPPHRETALSPLRNEPAVVLILEWGSGSSAHPGPAVCGLVVGAVVWGQHRCRLFAVKGGHGLPVVCCWLD